MTIELHKIQPQPGPDWCKCGWCHGGGFAGEKEPVCKGCDGKGWWKLAVPRDNVTQDAL